MLQSRELAQEKARRGWGGHRRGENMLAWNLMCFYVLPLRSSSEPLRSPASPAARTYFPESQKPLAVGFGLGSGTCF